MLQRVEQSSARLPLWVVSLCVLFVISLVVREGFAASDSNATIPGNPELPARGPAGSGVTGNAKPSAVPSPVRSGSRSTANASSPDDANAADKLRNIANRFAGEKATPGVSDSRNGTINSTAARPAGSFDASADQPANNGGGVIEGGGRFPLSGTAGSAKANEDASKANQQRLVDEPVSNKPLGPRGEGSGAGTGLLSGRDTPGESSGGMSVLDLLAALGLVIGLIFAGRSVVRRMVPGGSAGRSNSAVQVLSRTTVAPRNHVLLLRVGGRVLIVGDSTAGLRTLGEMTEAEEVADLLSQVSSEKPGSVTAGFKQMLKGFNGAYGGDAEARALADADADAGQGVADMPGDDEFHIDRARDRVSGLLGRLRNATGLGGNSSRAGSGSTPVSDFNSDQGVGS